MNQSLWRRRSGDLLSNFFRASTFSSGLLRGPQTHTLKEDDEWEFGIELKLFSCLNWLSKQTQGTVSEQMTEGSNQLLNTFPLFHGFLRFGLAIKWYQKMLAHLRIQRQKCVSQIKPTRDLSGTVRNPSMSPRGTTVEHNKHCSKHLLSTKHVLTFVV